MILNVVVILLVLGTGYLWLSRGFFSALINLICVVIGGAIAFAVWEPVAELILGVAPTTGLMGAIGGSAWGLALLVPFAIATGVIRVISDVVVRSNVKLAGPLDMAGGAICGAGTGVVLSGILVLGLGFSRFPPALAGYEPVEVNQGSPNSSGALWIPADTLVAGLYKNLSVGAFASGQPLADLYPNLEVTPATLRLTHNDGQGQNVLTDSDFSVSGQYTVAAEDQKPIAQLTGPDRWYSAQANVTNIDGDPYGAGHLRGYVVDFDAGARESSGQVIMSGPQVRLLLDKADGGTEETFPIAVVSVIEGDTKQFARFRFDSKDAIASAGAGDVKMAFEFPIPSGSTPRSLIVRNIRKPLEGVPVTEAFTTPQQRDAAIATGRLMGGESDLAQLDNLDAKFINIVSNTGTITPNSGVSVNTGFPLRLVMSKGSRGSIEINEDNQVINGREVYALAAFQNTRGLEGSLRVDRFAAPPGTVLVQLNVSADSDFSMLESAGQSADRDASPVLFDTDGGRYQSIGYVYRDDEVVRIRFTPSRPIAGLAGLDRDGIELSRLNQSQELVLLFAVSENVALKYFALGNKVITELEEPAPVGQARRR
ncbi:MAG: CvpA family protein [Planctomycetota bacterium]